MIVGYTQGTFDMFHVGHLNLLQNAREKCDYLIVGVNDDDLVKSYKQKEAIIPLKDRLAIVAALRCVDKAVPCYTLDKLVAFNMFKFQYLFIGDDWKGNQRYQETEAVLHPLGVQIVYLPYTKKISSSILREKIKKI